MYTFAEHWRFHQEDKPQDMGSPPRKRGYAFHHSQRLELPKGE